ncbi:MAG: tRNA epoxyqueuosine(34) reductase QueG [Betaproteobacteria bacterium]|nr:tRNA epoxyqueuosine(34) reductase QueG [Betaproteobacteria bacterium]
MSVQADASRGRVDGIRLAERIKQWGRELGFQALGIAGVDLSAAEPRLLEWLARGFHGEMDYMARHGARRARPAELVSGTVSVITARLDYRDPQARDSAAVLADADRAYVSRYALGRDYHKVLRQRLEHLAQRIQAAVEPFAYRVFTDSAPVMEVELARQAGLGWRGKHTLLLSRDAGSYYFLGEIFTDLPLPPDQPVGEHCGSCTRCLDVCPTQAIVAPYLLDATRCVSYLTIEHRGAIPEQFRAAIGNRVYGCDDCQLVCPWNKYARPSAEPDFAVRNGLDDATLADLFGWTREQFETRLAGSAIRRIGYERWLRNLATGLGNARDRARAVAALRARLDDPSALVREHVAWALARHGERA